MSLSALTTEIRQQTRRFVDGEISLREFRVAFNEADRLANYGRPSGTNDAYPAAMTDEIQDALSDFDDGFIDFDRLKQVISTIEETLRERARPESQDAAIARH